MQDNDTATTTRDEQAPAPNPLGSDKYAEMWAAPKPGEKPVSFNIDKQCIALISKKSVFFAQVCRRIRKIASYKIRTAGVTYDKNTGDLVMLFNPKFFTYIKNHPILSSIGDQDARNDAGDEFVMFVIQHELYHIIMDHLGFRRRTPHEYWNAATDEAINSILVDSGNKPPPGLLIPGVQPTEPDGTPVVPEPGSVTDVISKHPKQLASEWYFFDLMKQCPPPPGGSGSVEIDFGSGDDHSGWDEIPDEERSYITEKVKSIIERAAREADRDANGWGNIPASMREAIRKFISKQIDWRQILRAFIGRLVRGERSLTIKRINKRYPYVHPGTKRGYTAKLAICMDQSGSVSNELIELFFAELANLTRKTSVTIVPFDHCVHEKGVFEWKKGTCPKLERVACGGTCFDAPTDWVNSPKNRGRFDGFVVLTDGACSKPKTSRLRRAWVTGPGDKLMFETDELQIQITKELPRAEGPWH